MNKPSLKMTPLEGTADRIVKNRRIEARAGLSLDAVVERLDSGKQRATYGAVATIVRTSPRGLMHGRAKSSKDSWVVAANTSGDSRRGWPTGYTPNQIHPECLRQCRENPGNFIKDGEVLKRWLAATADHALRVG